MDKLNFYQATEVNETKKGLQMWSALLLLVSSLILLVPSLYTALSRVTSQNKPWIQILLGVVGVIVSLAQFAGGTEEKSA